MSESSSASPCFSETTEERERSSADDRRARDGFGALAPRGRFWLGAWMAALTCRALWLSLVHEPSRSVFSDMAGYYARSQEVFQSTRWSPYVFFQGAGYPIVLGFFRKLWAHDSDFGLVTGWLQLSASMAALAGTVFLTHRAAGRRWSGIALALGAVHVPWLFFTSVYMVEGLYTAALAGLGVPLVRLAREPEGRWGAALWLGLMGGAAAWLKSHHLFLGPIAALVWLYPLRRGWRGAARIVVGWFGALALVFWIPHGLLSARTSGRFFASPPSGGLNFVEGKCPWKENIDSEGYGYWSPLFVQQGLQNTKQWPESFLNQGYFFKQGLQCIAARPAVLLESLDSVRLLFFGNRLWPANSCGPRASRLSDAWALLFNGPLVLGLALALWFAAWRARRPTAPPAADSAVVWFALIPPALSLFAMVWVMKSEIRYRVPFDVFLFPLALWGFRECLASVRAWGKALLVAPAPPNTPAQPAFPFREPRREKT